MSFEPAKSELTHFSRAHKAPPNQLELGAVNLAPVESARFLGFWVDRKLRWNAHLAAVRKKLATQSLALTRIAGSTWGSSLLRAREVYVKVIRPVIAYGAPAYHVPATTTATSAVPRPSGIAKQLAVEQNRCLRVVTGGYRASPVRALEVEIHVPPIDLHLNKVLAQFEIRLQRSGMARQIASACAKVGRDLRRRRPRPTALQPPNRSDWVEQCLEPAAIAAPHTAASITSFGTDATTLPPPSAFAKAISRDWKARWDATTPRPYQREAADEPCFDGKRLRLYQGLRKATSSMLFQLRTGKIGLRAFLHERRVPDVDDPLCQCRQGPETGFHVVAVCPLEVRRRQSLSNAIGEDVSQWNPHNFWRALSSPGKATKVANWMIRSGRLPQYKLAEELRRRDEAGSDPAETEHPAPDPPPHPHPLSPNLYANNAVTPSGL